MKNNKKKGFTLIELLAVIVILAILVLVAMPAVTNIMQTAQKRSFKNEMLTFASKMDLAYTQKTLNFGDDSGISTVQIGDRNYEYFCMTLQQMVTQGYISKNLGTYKGYIQMWVYGDSSEQSTVVYINTTNGRYYFQGQLADVSTTHMPSQTPADGTTSEQLSKCPDTYNTFPTGKNK